MLPSTQKQTAHIDSGVVDEFMMRMSDNAADAVFVLQTLTDLYSRKDGAVIREVSTNAWDSHIMAGNPDPILVTLPKVGVSTPMFVVQDFGVGLDSADMDSIYVQFGKSLKRTNATATGMLGLGSKAPLTFAQTFTVVGVKNGIKTVAVVSKNDSGLGTMKVLSVLDTDEPDGVTVSVPVPVELVNQFNDYARDFYQYWRDGVLVDGEPPEVVETTMVLDDDLHVLGDYYGRDSVIVQGNVAYTYRTPDELPAVVAWVPMGAVDFTPNREALLYSDKTNEAIQIIADETRRLLNKTITDTLAACTTRYDRYKARIELREQLPNRYKDPALAVPRNLGEFFPDMDNDDPDFRYGWWGYRVDEMSRATMLKQSWISDETWSFVTGFPFKSVSTVHKEKLRYNGLHTNIVLVPATSKIQLDGFPRRDWESLREPPKQVRAQSVLREHRSETRYDFYVNGRLTYETEYEGDCKVLYVLTSEFYETGEAGQYAQQVSTVFRDDVVVAVIMSTQEAKFQRLHPGATSWRDHVAPKVKALERKLTAADQAYLDASSWERDLSQHFGHLASEIKDPQVRAKVRYRTSPVLDRLFDIHSRLERRQPISDDLSARISRIRRESVGTIDCPYLTKNYPLFVSGSRYYGSIYKQGEREDWIIYLNGRFAANKRAQKKLAENADNTEAAA